MRGGEDVRLRAHGDDPGHKLQRVYAEMILQVCRDYPGLPDPRTLTLHEIRFFYGALRKELREHTKPRQQQQPIARPARSPRRGRR